MFLVQEEEKIGSDSWTFLYSNIDGFEYQLGYIYDLLVVKKANQNPSADGSSERYELVKVVSKIEVDEMTGFRIKLKSASKVDPSSFVFGDLLTGFSLLGEIPIDCDTLCEELFEALGKENEVVGQFVHQGLDSIRLTEIVLQ